VERRIWPEGQILDLVHVANGGLTSPLYGGGVLPRTTLAALTLALLATLTGTASATTAYSDRLTGTEIVPVSSTRGTFVGVARGQLPAAWRGQIAHERLATGPTVSITGGSFVLLTRSGHTLRGAVTGGTVSVTDRGSHCTDQRYEVSASLSIGSFDGTLTHHRHAIFGRCLIYAATIDGRAVFNIS